VDTDEVLGRDVEVVLADLDALAVQLGREEDDERVPRIFIDLRPLVLVADVLERQRMKPKRLLEQLEVVVTGVFDVEPEALLAFREAGQQAVGRGIERGAVGRDNVPDRALRLVPLSIRDVRRRGTGPRRRYRRPT
jgi:class 3 adenylate cyclase